MENTRDIKRMCFFDAAKGIAIIAVIIGHMNLEGHGLGWLSNLIFSFHMPFFFLISGYFLSTRLDVNEYVKKKAKQLLIPYVITCIIVCLFSTIVCLYNGANIFENCKKWIWASVYGSGFEIFEPFHIRHIGAIWFLLALFFSLCVVRIAVEKKHTELIILIISFTGWVTAKYFWFPFSIQAGMNASAYVYIGYCAKNKKILDVKPRLAVILSMLIIWGESVYYSKGFYMVNNSYGNGLDDFIGGIAATYLIVIFFKWLYEKNKKCKILEFYGRNSLAILCFHLVELDIFEYTITWYFLNGQGFSENAIFISLILIKIAWATGWTLLMRCVSITRKAFNLS